MAPRPTVSPRRSLWIPFGLALVVVMAAAFFFFDDLSVHDPVRAASGQVQATSNSPTTYSNYPHIGLYGQYRTSGWPLIGVPGSTQAGPTDPLNESVMNGFAKHQRVILPLMPGADVRPDILTSLRLRNPNISIFGYALAYQVFCPQDGSGNVGYPVNSYGRDIYTTVTGGLISCTNTSDRFMWYQNGTRPDDLNINVNLAHRVQNPDSSFTYDIAEALASTMYEYTRPGRNWDGFEIDVFCRSIVWAESPGKVFDYARAGYGNDNTLLENRTAFDLGWQAGFDRLNAKFRELAIADGHPDFPIFGNCGIAPKEVQPNMNGWLHENFPMLNTDFYRNLLEWPGGYLHSDYLMRTPQESFINVGPNQDGPDPLEPTSQYNPYSTGNQRRMRFGLGAATLGNGTSMFNLQDIQASSGSWWNWWFDEYGVQTNVPQSDSTYGQSANGAQYLGWLGQPLTPAYQQLATNYAGGADLFSNNLSFETAGGTPESASGWTTVTDASANATVTRDTTEAADGSASMKAVVGTSPASPFGKVTLSNTTFFPITNGQEYSITFKAKASANLPLHVTFHFGSAPNLTLPLDTEWRQYQAVIRPDASDADSLFRFEFGLGAGTYWVDDVHVRAGASSVWRRDFERGSVFVNPTLGPITIQLGTPMKKIAGTVNPSLNDGSTVSSLTLAGTNSGGGYGDAVFLLSIDAVAPAAVSDLRSP